MGAAQNVDAIVKEIESTFARIRLEDGTSISEGTVIDAYGGEGERRRARMLDEKNDWRLIPDRAIRKHQTSLTFMDAKGYRFNLPSYLRFVLRNYITSDSNSIDNVFHNLGNKSDDRRMIFSQAEREAIRMFLNFFATEPNGWYKDYAHRALPNWQ